MSLGMIGKRLLTVSLIIILSSPLAYGQTGATSPIFGQDQCLYIAEEDGDPFNIICGPLLVPNDSLTDNGDGTFSLTFSTSDSTSFWEEDGNSDLQPLASGSGTNCWEESSGALQPVTTSSCTDTFWQDDGNGDLQPKA